jgi:hypothetical protein
MKAYLNPWFVTLLMWGIWAAPRKECTRCGGYGHSLSQCTWPAVEKE